jgi:NADH-quinone oxidoreductase subunit L
MFDLAWLIPLAPFVAFLLIALGLHRRRTASQWAAIGGIIIALVLSLGVFWTMVREPTIHKATLTSWFSLGKGEMQIGVYIDPTDAVMIAMVSIVCLMIFVYSVGYMKEEARYSRFFAYISLFAGSMLGAMVCDNLLLFFVFWELMGTCSYLLIGFAWERKSAAQASLKAFLVTKTGDLFLLLGLVLLYAEVGSLAYTDLFAQPTLERLAETAYAGDLSIATVAVLLLFGGTIGKSAQFPLHVWLPDAMEGPTPASALIHAATMVSAGVYLMVRAFPLLAVSQAMPVVAIVGTVTALFAAVIALAQDDIKRVLAFSTISQLGYMVAALGLGAYAAAIFHLLTHAFFKALLFMAAGSVIHGVEHGHHYAGVDGAPGGIQSGVSHHDPGHKNFNPNDMWKMGGLALRMPVTALTFLAGSLSLSGFPLITAGFWSKDEILVEAWGGNHLVFWGLALAAGLTAFYSARQLSLTFLGAPRSKAAVHAHENPSVMTLPLIVLALFALGLGWVGIPDAFPVLGELVPNYFTPFVESSVDLTLALEAGEGHIGAEPWQPLVLGLVMGVGGLASGWWVYGRRAGAGRAQLADPVAVALSNLGLAWLYRAIENRAYLDEVYDRLVVKPAVWLSTLSYVIDHDAIDALVVSTASGFAQVHGPSASDRIDRVVFDGPVRAAGFVSRWLAEITLFLDSELLDGVVKLVGHFTGWLSRNTVFFDLGLIDGTVKLAGLISRLFSGFVNLFDSGVIDGLVHGIADLFQGMGRWVRRAQNGMLPDYLWNAFVMILLLVAILVMARQF